MGLTGAVPRVRAHRRWTQTRPSIAVLAALNLACRSHAQRRALCSFCEVLRGTCGHDRRRAASQRPSHKFKEGALDHPH